jgi:hypothetical protein
MEAPIQGFLLYDSGSTNFGNGLASTGVKQSFGLGRVYSDFSYQVSRSTGGSTRATLQLQGRVAPSGAGQSGFSSTAAWHNIGAAITVNAQSILANSTNSLRVSEVRAVVTGFSTLASTTAVDRPARVRIWLGVKP